MSFKSQFQSLFNEHLNKSKLNSRILALEAAKNQAPANAASKTEVSENASKISALESRLASLEATKNQAPAQQINVAQTGGEK